MRPPLAVLTLLFSGALGAACSRATPPTFDAAGVSPSVAPLETSLPAPSASGVPARAASSAAPSAPAASSSADSATLPQTTDQPTPGGPAFDARVAALWEAIVNDDPTRAMPFFFPLGAYEQVKDIPIPKNDWEHRLVAHYRRDIHALHAHLGDSPDRAKFVRLDVPMERARWVKPDEEWNKIGYYRVFGSRIRYELDGKERSLEITSMISWRGEWFVVHLTGVK